MASDKHERTEKPTAKRRREARKRGQVVRSTEIAGWAGLMAVSFVLPALFGRAAQQVLGLQARSLDLAGHPSAGGAVGLLGAGLRLVLQAGLVVGTLVALIGVVANVAQVGLHLSPEALRPKLNRLSPKAGMKRLLGPAGWWEAGRALLKIGLLSVLAVTTTGALVGLVGRGSPIAIAQVGGLTAGRLLALVRLVAAAGLALGGLDYLVQRRRIGAQMKMTKQEIKEESRQADGDPTLKAAVRRRMARMSRLRMMAAVSQADVVVVNPTHVAVALRYDPVRCPAPTVLAKGADEVAARIRAEAVRTGVPIVEDPPLARAVFAHCDLDEQIPPELFIAVARLLAFIFALPAPARSQSGPHRDPARSAVG